MKIIAHIGLSKNFSTSIQRSVFIKNPEILYLGVGHNKNNLDYISYKIENLFEYHLRYTKKIIFENELKKHRELIKKYILKAKKNGKKALVFSVDTLSVKLTPYDIDPFEKYERLRKLFGPDLKIILIIKNQIDLLKSFYRETVKLGNYEKYNDYISRILKLQKSFYLNDFFYDHQYLSLTHHFKKRNIKILQAEDYLQYKKTDTLIDDIYKFLKLNKHNSKLGHYNKSLGSEILEKKRILNKKINHDISNFTFDIIESHRLKNFFSKELDLPHLKKDPFKDVKIKNKMISSIKSNKNLKIRLSYNLNKNIYNKLIKLIKKSNLNFQKLSNLKLKKNYLK